MGRASISTGWRWFRPASTLAALALVGCGKPPPPPPAPAPVVPPPEATVMRAPRESSPYVATPYAAPTVTPALPAYTVRPDLQNVVNLAQFPELTADQKRCLGALGFVVVPDTASQLDVVYRDNLADGRPAYLTSDAALLAWQRVVEDIARRLDGESFPALVNAWTMGLVERSMEQYRRVSSPELKEAARRNVAYFGVAAGLLGLSLDIESGAARLVAQETEQIAAEPGPAESVILPYQVDYARVRAPADSPAERLARYHQAVAWYAAAPLAAEVGEASGRTAPCWPVARQLALLGLALAAEPEPPLANWQKMDDARRWLYGAPAGLAAPDLLAAAEEVYGAERKLADLADFGRLQLFVEALKKRLPPPALPPAHRPGRPGRARLTLVAAAEPVDQELVVELAAGGTPVSGLDVMAALGQTRAEELVRIRYQAGAKRPRLAGALTALRDRLTARGEAAWRSDLAWGRLWAAAALSGADGSGYPVFQHGDPWRDRALLTCLATWAAARRPPAPWSPSAAEPRPEPEPPAHPPVTYVEPVPAVYARLRWQAEATLAGLLADELLTDSLREPLELFIARAALLEDAAVKELANQSLATADRQKLAALAHDLRWLIGGLDFGLPADRRYLPVVSRLNTAGDRVTCVGLGPVQRLYVVVPHRGKLYLARGAVMSYAEATRPADQPLDDAAWRSLLTSGAVALPRWTAEFVVPTPDLALPSPTAEPVFVD